MTNWQEYEQTTRRFLIEQVKAHVSPKRWQHILGVEESALELAKRYQVDLVQASSAALVHDYAKECSDEVFLEAIDTYQLDPELKQWTNEIWHGIVGAELIRRDLKIEDEAVLEAVRVHTTGAKEMSPLSQVLYVADYIEPNRQFPGVNEARELAKQDLTAAVAYETKHTLAFLIQKEVPIYPKTIETYNSWVAKRT
ncbi:MULTISPECIES: bis(5'-nucleosyl)-tetraphosphatase (symmetrical) YqeK [Enterococcus]|uniref:bis(5'-nucleosyl)-tetraphosphatase (symmetrical) n=1 Tax=Enterococcus sulfureus ATCC 49903 TaxID=1140003 RepID=S0L670_9ENTE|nr:bis(5'-nucleosyl)-tetraphosphatase (symmetrical) YqeK [Enterococcus sulfureus]EOT46966.1 hypothetical protein OMY_01216 [Enterococcus sulfureus ATCC 49903]EOT83739.1 hypothetical protein I573_01464 [Enterococcus sulfureus ATCC 49903]